MQNTGNIENTETVIPGGLPGNQNIKNFKEELAKQLSQPQPEPQNTQNTAKNLMKDFLPAETEESKEIVEESVKPNEVKIDKIQEALMVLEEELDVEAIEIFLPGIKENVIVNPLTAEEDLILKTTNISFYTYMQKLNKLIANHTFIKGKSLLEIYGSVEKFLANILPVDKALMIFALSKNSFTNLNEYPMNCETCGKEFIAESDVKNMDFKFGEDVIKLDYYNYKITQELLNGVIEIDLGFNPEYIRDFIMKTETEEEIKENAEQNNVLLNLLNNIAYFIKELRVYKKDGRAKNGKKLVSTFNNNLTFEDGKYVFNNTIELLKFLRGMPLKTKQVFTSKIDLNDISKKSPEFFIKEVCPFCGHVHDNIMSPEIEFFRKALSFIG